MSEAARRGAAFRPPRRIVTGHDAAGTSVVLSDAPVPVTRELPEDGVAFHEVWATRGAPAVIEAGYDEPTAEALTVPPPARGTRIRINEFLPAHLDPQGLQSPMHRTESVDYGIVLEGEVTLVLDDSEVTAYAGDIVIQRGTDHAWANRGDRVARVAFVLIDARYDDDVLATLPTDVRDSLMRHGPRA
ncbi:cupin domain-containing protein [Microbacterium sp. SORGH_AS_0862]|uniref:cupin domain-containing protein n=1 Tax=Microbacterium sp. SORGH_AS_0862 TaxID=3041789 RepID=UPI00278D3411|nr:cupin domain-containing protein [Microbacterium sp. SORGH_AS_0862]MDQ1204824.1 mannose-6-phosphate isomerase-like protein (cupin superfamily) [Microbacterium sp. SORGH_AS_0862]